MEGERFFGKRSRRALLSGIVSPGTGPDPDLIRFFKILQNSVLFYPGRGKNAFHVSEYLMNW
jgi:hypothetical protein